MNTITISDITAQKLISGDYQDDFPEYYALKGKEENSSWHVHQDVFNHVTAVFAALEKAETLEFLNEPSRSFMKAYLQRKVSSHTRGELLRVATLLHDIAKQFTVVVDVATGNAGCPGHELMATGMVPDFSERFGLDKQEESYVERIVRFHGFISEILNQILANENKELYWSLFEKTVGDVAIELALLMYADLWGADLQTTNPRAHEDRVNLLISYLHTKVVE